MPARPTKARYLIALLSAILLFEAGATAPAFVSAQEEGESPPIGAEPTVAPSPEPDVANEPDPAGEPAEPEPSTTGPTPADPAPRQADEPPSADPPGIERVDLRTADSRTFERDDGSFVTQFFTGPVFYQPPERTDWQPIDVRLEPAAADSERLVADEMPVRVALDSADATHGFLSVDAGGRTISFRLPASDALTVGDAAPEIRENGLFAEYTDFLPGGIDLRVFPRADGAKSWLVFGEPPAQASFTFELDAPGLTLVPDPELDNALLLVDARGTTVARIPQPLMVDSSDVEGFGSGELSVDVALTFEQDGDAKTITLTPDRAFLERATYPVYLDPTLKVPDQGGNAFDTHVTDGYPTTNFATYCRPDSPYYCEWTIGRWPGGSPYHSEALIKFNGVRSTLGAVRVDGATFSFWPYWQYQHYQFRPSWVERITQSWTSTSVTWNTRPATADDLDPGYLESKEGVWANFDMADHYQEVLNGTLAENGFKIHATGTTYANWKRVISREQGGSMAAYRPYLEITWTAFAPPASASPTGGGATASRTLSWSHDPAAVQSSHQVQVSTVSNFGSILADSGTVSGSATSWTIPGATTLAEGTTYYWRVRAKWGLNSAFSAWSSTASFVWSPDANLGLQGHNTFETFDLGNGDTLAVNVATGNVVLHHPLVDLPYRGGALSLSLSYNSFTSADAGMGPGWRISAMRRLSEQANGDVVYIESDGSRHRFTKIGTTGSVTTYTRPATLYATLVKDTSASPQWTLTWRDLSVDKFTVFNAVGLLTRSADRHGNGIDFSHYANSNRIYRATDPAGRFVEFTWDTGVSPARLVSFTDWAYVSNNQVQASQTGARRLYRFFYDSGGQLIGWSNPKNTSGACPTVAFHLACLSYTDGRLSTITKRQLVALLSGSSIGSSARNVTATLLYTGGQISEIRDPVQTFANAIGTTFAWVAPGRLRVVRPGTPNSTTTYGQVGGTTDPLGRIASVWRKLGSTDIEQRTVWNASFPTEPASVTDNFGAKLNTPARTVSYSYLAGSLGLVATVTEPLTGTNNRTTTYTYNANNDVTRIVVAGGGTSTTTRFCYADSGCPLDGTRLTMRARIDNWEDGAKGGTKGNEEDVTVEYLYDSFGQFIRETRWNYDAAGSLLDSRAIGHTYDAHGNVTSEIVNYANGTVTSPGDDITPNATTNARTDLTTVHTYDTAGNRISSADPRRAIELAKGTSLGPDDFVTRWEYDTLSLRALEVTPTTPGVTISCAGWAPNCRQTIWIYDGEERLRSSTDFGNLRTVNVFDRAGRVIETLEDPPDVGGTTPAVRTSLMTYDAAGRVLTVKDRRQLADSSLGQTSYQYDALGRQLSVTEAAGADDAVATTSAFDALARQTELDYGGLTTTYRYDLGGRVLEQDDSFACTRTTYDYRDLALTAVEGLASGASACTGTGLRTIGNTYDGLGRLLESKVTAGEGLNDVPSSAAYDAAGNALSSASVAGTTTTSVTYTINPLDQLIREVRSDNSMSRTNYDPVGNPTDACYWASGSDEACQSVDPPPSFTNPPSRHTTSAYDARNQRIELIDAATTATTAYDPNHNYQPKAMYVPTGTGREHQTIYSYDERHRLVGITHQLCVISAGHACTSTTPTGSNSYAYDLNDNRSQVIENNGTASSDRRYCYDAQNRLVHRRTGAACTSSPDETYEYDVAGNRTKAIAGGVTTNFAYNTVGQLCKVGATTCSSPNVIYDSAGRISLWNGWWLSYDAEGRLTNGCKSSGCATSAERVEFTYDGEGRRTEIRTAPANGALTTLELRYQSDAAVEEWTNGTLTRSYIVDEAGTILKMVVPSGVNAGVYLVTWNGHGDALALWRIKADGTLELANSFTYSTWGAPTITGNYPNSANNNANYGDLGFRYLYVGQFGVQWDNAFGLGLHYMQARHYSPALGRFLQPDPAQLESNHYGYATNSPVTKIDPDGTYTRVLMLDRDADGATSRVRLYATNCNTWRKIYGTQDAKVCYALKVAAHARQEGLPGEIVDLVIDGLIIVASRRGPGGKQKATRPRGPKSFQGLPPHMVRAHDPRVVKHIHRYYPAVPSLVPVYGGAVAWCKTNRVKCGLLIGAVGINLILTQPERDRQRQDMLR